MASAPAPDIVCVPLQVIVFAHSRSDVLVGATVSYCVLGSHMESDAQTRSPCAVRPDVYCVAGLQTAREVHIRSVVVVGSNDSKVKLLHTESEAQLVCEVAVAAATSYSRW
jgi:hypothetical protein